MKILFVGPVSLAGCFSREAGGMGHEVVCCSEAEGNGFLEWKEKPELLVYTYTVTEPPQLLLSCLRSCIPVVCRLSPEHRSFDMLASLCRTHGGALLYGLSFSLLVQLFLWLNLYLTAFISEQPEYQARVVESGHSIGGGDLATEICAQLGNRPFSLETPVNPFGFHECYVSFGNTQEEIAISYQRRSVQSEAAGLLKAALFLQAKKGIFTMEDVLLDKWRRQRAGEL